MATLTDKLNIDIYGDKELNKFFLKSLKFGQQRSIFISAYKKAAAPLVKQAKANLTATRKRKGVSNLKKSIGTYASSGKVQLLVGTRRFGNFKGYHGHLVDRGTVQRYRKSSTGKPISTGKMKGTNFWSKALESEGSKIGTTMQTEMSASLSRFVDKNLKRINKVA